MRGAPAGQPAGVDRNLDWEGCFNVRDLGGLRTLAGLRTRWRALVRADDLAYLTPGGWQALWAYGIRTIVDLRNDEEVATDLAPRPAGLTMARVPLDDLDDREFWEHCWANELDGSPLYYRPFLERKPERCAAALAAVARAGPGGVAFHCGGGRDRTGLVSLLLEALAGGTPEDIVADYELSNVRLPALWSARGAEDQVAEIEAIIARANTTARDLIVDLLASLDADDYLRRAGIGEGELAALRARLLGASAESTPAARR